MPASITLTVAHLPTSTSFFLACLQPLSYVYRGRVDNTIGFGLPDAAPDFWITQSIPGVPPGPAHVAFPATSREVVHAFFIAAIKAGGRCHGEPALRDAHSGYYSAAIIDLDNNSIEAVYRPDLMNPQTWNTADTRSGVSQTQRSSAKSRTPTEISSSSKTRSLAPSHTQSIAPSALSKSMVSHTRSAADQSVTSRVSTRAPPPPATTTQGSGGMINDFLADAKGTINVARELVGSISSHTNKNPSTPDSHQPSDAIVGTLLGVAAGAALHYAFTSSKKSHESNDRDRVLEMPHPGLARSETAPSYTQQRYKYYHNPEYHQPQLALEAAPSSYTRASGQRLIEMIDNDPSLSEYYVPSAVRRGRRNSYSGVAPSQTSTIRTTTTRMSRKVFEAAPPPPTSYRAPTAITSPESRTQLSRRSSTRSRSMSGPRDRESGISSYSPRQDEGYASASESRSRASRRSSSTVKPKRAPSTTTSSSRRISSSPERSTTSRKDSGSRMGSVVTTIRTPVDPTPSRKATSIVIARAPDDDKQSFYSSKTSTKSARPSPPSTTSKSSSHKPNSVSGSHASRHSRNSGSNKSRPASEAAVPERRTEVIGTLTQAQLERLSDNGRPRSDITKSVIGKVKDMDHLDLSSREVGPEDSVSQVSSNHSRGSKRSSRR